MNVGSIRRTHANTNAPFSDATAATVDTATKGFPKSDVGPKHRNCVDAVTAISVHAAPFPTVNAHTNADFSDAVAHAAIAAGASANTHIFNSAVAANAAAATTTARFSNDTPATADDLVDTVLAGVNVTIPTVPQEQPWQLVCPKRHKRVRANAAFPNAAPANAATTAKATSAIALATATTAPPILVSAATHIVTTSSLTPRDDATDATTAKVPNAIASAK